MHAGNEPHVFAVDRAPFEDVLEEIVGNAGVVVRLIDRRIGARGVPLAPHDFAGKLRVVRGIVDRSPLAAIAREHLRATRDQHPLSGKPGLSSRVSSPLLRSLASPCCINALRTMAVRWNTALPSSYACGRKAPSSLVRRAEDRNYRAVPRIISALCRP